MFCFTSRYKNFCRNFTYETEVISETSIFILIWEFVSSHHRECAIFCTVTFTQKKKDANIWTENWNTVLRPYYSMSEMSDHECFDESIADHFKTFWHIIFNHWQACYSSKKTLKFLNYEFEPKYSRLSSGFIFVFTYDENPNYVSSCDPKVTFVGHGVDKMTYLVMAQDRWQRRHVSCVPLIWNIIGIHRGRFKMEC
jgi:hypothetical protein